jgi:hypothetical protein
VSTFPPVVAGRVLQQPAGTWRSVSYVFLDGKTPVVCDPYVVYSPSYRPACGKPLAGPPVPLVGDVAGLADALPGGVGLVDLTIGTSGVTGYRVISTLPAIPSKPA